MPTILAITGSTGRMGKRLVALAEADPELKLLDALTRNDTDLNQSAQVLIDFTSPQAMRIWLEVCQRRKIAMVIGTTGLEPRDLTLIEQAAKDIPILQSANMSVGVNVLLKLIADTTKSFGDCDIEIVEAHHRFKKDAPSGTAVALAKATGREVPMHSLRIGDEVGTHTIYFAALGERLELKHVATNRDTFALGALRAAKWLATQEPGRYTMADVLTSSR